MVRTVEAERRQLTVLFCDMVGSTEIAAELGAEDWREMLRDYQRMVAGVVKRFDGSIAQYLGDGVVAYFGHPSAHEDDAERAVRSALAIVEIVSARGPELEARYGRHLEVRVGVHTGPVVVGEVGSGERSETLAVGATTNVAARIESEARPGTVVVSAATLRLVRGIFATESLGARTLKGLAAPVELHRVIRPTGASTRLEVASLEELSPFVGRVEELALLDRSWCDAREGRGQVVLLGGEAGMGKSRLLQVFRENLTGDGHRWIECRASNFHSHTAFHPLSKLIEQTLHLEPDGTAEQQLAQLAKGLGDMGLDPSESAPLFASLLGLPVAKDTSPFAVTVEARRRITLDALSKWLLALAEPQPVVLVIEDLHWLDSSTLDLLGLLIHRVPETSVLIIATFRPSFEPPWDAVPHARQVTLGPLTQKETHAMLTGLTGGAALPARIRDQVVAKTDGVPLFVEEFTQAVLESGAVAKRDDRYEETGPIPTSFVPSTLQDSLMARLDRLGPAKKLAQLAAILGRDFSHALLTTVASDAQSLERDLSTLVGAGILQQAGEPSLGAYAFKHALIQDTAYQSLLKSSRRAWHTRVADALETHFADSAVAEPERLAWHCEQGNLLDRAVGHYQRAAEQAQQRAASTEAIRHLSCAIELLQSLPDSAERAERELQLQIELGMTVAAVKGWGNADAEAAYSRARELCEHIGELPQVFQVTRGLVIYYTAKSELGTANELGKRLMELAEQSGETDLLLPAHQQRGILHHYSGNPTEAIAEFEQAIALYEPSAHRHLTQLYGEDLGVLSRIWMAWSQWLVGHPDQAVDTCNEARELAEQVGHQFSLAYVFAWTSMLHVMRREPERARAAAEQANVISARHGFSLLLSQCQLIVAWSRLQEPLDEIELPAAVAEFQAGVNKVSGTGIVADAPIMIGFLADAYHRAGQYPMALVSLEAGLAISQTTGQAQWDAELHRLKGEFLLHAQADESNVEELFHRALEIARAKRTRSLELRTAVSLGRLWKKQGQPERARELVAPIYDRFTEGFDSPDLIEARELLADG